MNEAVLTSQTPVTVDVDLQVVIELYFAFDVSGMGVEFGDGGLKVGVTTLPAAAATPQVMAMETGSPLLSSAAALGALCPGRTVSLGGGDVEVLAKIKGGGQQADSEGELDAPIAGATRVLGTCISFSSAIQNGQAGPVQRSPWFFFLPVSSSLVYLSQAWSTAENIQDVTFQDPANPSETLDFIHVQVGYNLINWESLKNNTLTQPDGPLALQAFETPACSGSENPMYRYIMTADDNSVGEISGDATFSGEEDTVEVFGVCHSSFRATSPGSIAKGVMQPLTVVKKTDSTTALFLHILDVRSTSQIQLHGYRQTSSGQYTHEVTYELDNAQLTGLNQTTVGDCVFEWLEFDFSSFNLTWTPAAYQYTYSPLTSL